MKYKLLFTCAPLIFTSILFASSSPEIPQQRGLRYIRAGLYNQAQQEFQRILSTSPDDIESYYQLGKAYQLDNMLDQAVNIYHQVLQRKAAKKLHGLTCLSLTEIYIKQGDFKSAEASVQQAIALNPQMAQTHYQLGNVYTHRNRLDLAKTKFNESVRLDPGFAEAYQWLGRIALMQNQLEKSIGYYTKAITLKPDHASSYYNLAKIYRLKGDSSRVTEYLEKFKKIKSYQDEVYRYKKSVDENPADLLIRMDLAGIHLDNDNINEALNVYKSIILLDPTMASAYDKLGKAYMEQGKFQEAANAFEKIVELDQNAVEPYLRLAWIYSNQRRFDLAESYLQVAMQKSPDLTLPYHGLAEIYVQQGKLEKAIETYHQLTKIDQNDLDAWLELGNLQIHLKKLNAAIYAFQQALETDSNCDQAYQRIAWIYADQEVYLDLAEKFAAKAVKIDPSASNLSTSSYVYFKNGKYDKAKELIQRAINIEPKNQAYHTQLRDIQNAGQNEQ